MGHPGHPGGDPEHQPAEGNRGSHDETDAGRTGTAADCTGSPGPSGSGGQPGGGGQESEDPQRRSRPGCPDCHGGRPGPLHSADLPGRGRRSPGAAGSQHRRSRVETERYRGPERCVRRQGHEDLHAERHDECDRLPGRGGRGPGHRRCHRH